MADELTKQRSFFQQRGANAEFCEADIPWESLNADILVYFPVLDIALELSSMGIRVDAKSLAEQLEKSGCQDRAELPFQKAILNDELPFTIGGGIGQSRLCMFFLRKAHIGEVQSSIWPVETEEALLKAGIQLL